MLPEHCFKTGLKPWDVYDVCLGYESVILWEVVGISFSLTYDSCLQECTWEICTWSHKHMGSTYHKALKSISSSQTSSKMSFCFTFSGRV